MRLTQNQFDVLFCLLRHDSQTQREISEATGLGLGTVNAAVRECVALGYIEGRKLTESGRAALEPYRVQNAIIMAAGFSSRFVPLSYERPKGLLEVHGEVLIERQILQLQEAGITDITVVVGYMKETLFYLEEMLGVQIVVNGEYAKRNNNSTLMVVREKLGNTYICSSDNYFSENVFESHVYSSYYSAQFQEGETDEYCITAGSGGRITKVDVGGADSLIMIGHAYFDRSFAQKFVDILTRVYDRPETASKLWEDIYMDHLRELPMTVREYPIGMIHEFDSLNDLVQFDHDFTQNVDSSILDNICRVLTCDREQIVDLEPINEGLTNLSFKFSVRRGGERETYVYRHPGVGTDEIINRASEAFSQTVAKKLDIDDTFIYQDPDTGWKISRFVEVVCPFDYHNRKHVSEALDLIRRLHQSGECSEWTHDLYEESEKIRGLLASRSYPGFPDFDSLAETARHLSELVKRDDEGSVLCHNDFYGPNFLVSADRIDLIDWEYSAMSDYASDLGVFICCSDYTLDEARTVINAYFGGEATPEQMRRSLAFVSLAGYYWFVWALYKDATGDPVGEWLYLWYKFAKDYAKIALDLYAKETAPV